MGDFEATWRLTRGRFEEVIAGLDQRQLNWRLHPKALTLAEAAVHVAGVEVFFLSQLLDRQLDGFAARVSRAATEGVVNDAPYPFTPDELTPELVQEALQLGRSFIEPVIGNLTDEIRAKQIKSALGPIIDGTGAFARLAHHPAYHQGQGHLIKSAPGFPE